MKKARKRPQKKEKKRKKKERKKRDILFFKISYFFIKFIFGADEC